MLCVSTTACCHMPGPCTTCSLCSCLAPSRLLSDLMRMPSSSPREGTSPHTGPELAQLPERHSGRVGWDKRGPGKSPETAPHPLAPAPGAVGLQHGTDGGLLGYCSAPTRKFPIFGSLYDPFQVKLVPPLWAKGNSPLESLKQRFLRASWCVDNRITVQDPGRQPCLPGVHYVLW